MKAKVGQWTFNSTDWDVWYHDTYETKEEAIEAAKKYYDCPDDGNEFYIGQVTVVDSHLNIDPDLVLERISEQVYEEVGEVGEDYLRYVKEEHKDILEERLNKVIFDWMDEFNYKPNFYRIDNIEKIVIE